MSRVFTIDDREQLLERLVEAARADADVVAAAVVGSGATGRADEWSDIDLALRIRDGGDDEEVATRWSAMLRADHGAVDQLDVVAGGVLYRVFLLGSSLQVDVSFWPFDEFRATEDGFRLLFGTANVPTQPSPVDPDDLVGMAWLYALHARSAIARGRLCQAMIMVDGLRDQLVALACARRGLNPHQGRGADRLPAALLADLIGGRATTVTPTELHRSLSALLACLMREVHEHDPVRADTITPAVTAMVDARDPEER